MRGKVEIERKGWNSTLYNKQWREKNRKQWRNIERISKALWRFTTKRPPENLQKEKIEQDINIKFCWKKKITQKAILKMKNNKSGDRSRWKAEWLKEGGVEMIESLTTIFNRVEEEGHIPLQLRETSIKSLYKGGGSK